ncbi:hypothetical protein BDQ17DRAFT_1004688 [Cyathus striatus]|nr:hypothetical protein BDQ17DRAFT_1004688 [Cyathus striatus]
MGVYDTTLGVLLIGIFFNTYLYGIVSYQFAAYYMKKFNDPLWTKTLILILFVLDTFHSAAVIYMAWEYCVQNYNNPSILAFALWPYTFTPIGTALAAIITHLFLGIRIYRMMKNRYVIGVISVLALASFSTGVACGTQAWIIKEAAKLDVLTTQVTWWLGLQTTVDFLIAGLMCWTLWKSRTSYRRTNTVINRLMRGAIQTGFFAAIFAMGDLIAFSTSPTTNFYGMFAIPIGRIYTNTLMDVLNMRDSLQEMLTEPVELSVSSRFFKDSRRSLRFNVQDNTTRSSSHVVSSAVDTQTLATTLDGKTDGRIPSRISEDLEFSYMQKGSAV